MPAIWATPQGTISIRELGYSPRPQRDAFNFVNDEVLAYLGPRELLVAFNPHELVSRDAPGTGSTVRIIRAAVVDTETHRVTHTVDWEMLDNGNTSGRWRMAMCWCTSVRSSASMARTADFGIEFPLEGPLAFVRVTPDGSFMAIGVLRERHTPELHAALRESLNGDPEEDVRILVLNRSFETIAQSTAESNLMAPTLLNEGQVTLTAQSNMSCYRISMVTWDQPRLGPGPFHLKLYAPAFQHRAGTLFFLVSCDTAK